MTNVARSKEAPESRLQGRASRKPLTIYTLPRFGRMAPSSRHRFYQFLSRFGSEQYRFEVNYLLDDLYLSRLYSTGGFSKGRLLLAYFRRFGMLARAVAHGGPIWVEKEFFPYLPALAERCLALLGVPYVVDYDDPIFHTYDLHRNPLVRLLLSRKIDQVMRHAHSVVAGSGYLADRAWRAGATRVYVVPTLIPCSRYTLAPKFRTDTFRIGWIGSPTTAKYLREVHPALRKLSEYPGVEVHLIGSGEIELEGVRVKIIEWRDDTEVENLAELDAGIAPLSDGPWERGKCGYKILQYMAARLPVVASPVGEALNIVQDGITGYFAATPGEFLARLTELKHDPALRERMGQAGRIRVEQHFSTEARAHEVLEILGEAAALSRGGTRSPVAAGLPKATRRDSRQAERR